MVFLVENINDVDAINQPNEGFTGFPKWLNSSKCLCFVGI